MKKLATIAAMLLTVTCLGAQVPKTVTADTNTSAILWPANLFAANSNALNASIPITAVAKGGTGATSAADARVNLGITGYDELPLVTDFSWWLLTNETDVVTWRAGLGLTQAATNTATWATTSGAATARGGLGVYSTSETDELLAHKAENTNAVFVGTLTAPDVDAATAHIGTLTTTNRIAPANLGTGTPDASTFLRGDGTYAVPPGSGAISGMPAIATVSALMSDSSTNSSYYLLGYTSPGDGGQGVVNKKTGVTSRFARDGGSVSMGGTGYTMSPLSFATNTHGSGYVTGLGTVTIGGSLIYVMVTASASGWITNATLYSGVTGTTDTNSLLLVTQTGASGGYIRARQYCGYTRTVAGGTWTSQAQVTVKAISAGQVTRFDFAEDGGHPTTFAVGSAGTGYSNGAAWISIGNATINVTLTTAAGAITGIAYTSGTAQWADVTTVVPVLQSGGAGGLCTPGTWSYTGHDSSYAEGAYSVLPGTATDNWRQTVTLTDGGDETLAAQLTVYVYGYGGMFFPCAGGYWERPREPYVSVDKFGARPSDAVDDTIPVQAAVDYALQSGTSNSSSQTNSTVVFSSGQYRIIGGVVARGNHRNGNRTFSMQGQGSGQTSLYDSRLAVANAVAVDIGDVDGGSWYGEGSSTMYRFCLRGLSIVGAGPFPIASLTTGLRLRNTLGMVMDDVCITFFGYGMDVNQTANGDGEWSKVTVGWNTRAGTVLSQVTRMHISVEANGDGLVLYSGAGGDIQGAIQGNYGAGLYFADYTKYYTVHGCWMENNSNNVVIGYSPAWSWATSGAGGEAAPHGIVVRNNTFAYTTPHTVSGTTYTGGESIDIVSGHDIDFEGNYIGPRSTIVMMGSPNTTVLYTPWLNIRSGVYNVREKGTQTLTDGYGARWGSVSDATGVMGRPLTQLWLDGECEYGAQMWSEYTNATLLTVYSTNTIGHGDTSSLVVEQVSTSASSSSAHLYLDPEMLQAMAGKSVVFGCWVYTPREDPWDRIVTTDMPVPRIRLVHASGGIVNLKAGFGGMLALTNTWSWLQCDTPLTIPAGATNVYLAVDLNYSTAASVPAGARLFLDDFRLVDYGDSRGITTGDFARLQPSKYTGYFPSVSVTNTITLGTITLGSGADDPPTAAWANGSIYSCTGGKLYFRTGGAWVQVTVP